VSASEHLDTLAALGGKRQRMARRVVTCIPRGRLTSEEQGRLAFACYRLGVLTSKGAAKVFRGSGQSLGWSEA